MSEFRNSQENVKHNIVAERLLYLPRGTERLENLGHIRSFKKGHLLIRPEEIPDTCYVVKSGRVIAYEFTQSGEEQVYNFNEPGSILLEANVLMQWPAQVYFKVVMPTDLICISRTELLQAAAKDPELSLDILQSVSTKFFSAMDQVRQANCHNVSWKICNLLLTFSRRYGEEYDGKLLIKEHLSQQMISNMLGINRITTVRAIGELKSLGLIEHINGYYCIRNVEALQRHQEYLDTLGSKCK